jgi:acetoin utilization deacetylase AcuC-like enzyme
MFQPDFVIYDAGADTHLDDALGLLNLTSEGHYKRDHFILSACAERQIPVSCVIGGGYMKDRKKLAVVHGIVHRAAHDVWQEHY